MVLLLVLEELDTISFDLEVDDPAFKRLSGFLEVLHFIEDGDLLVLAKLEFLTEPFLALDGERDFLELGEHGRRDLSP